MILCSRKKCGCMASALLSRNPTNADIAEFVANESFKGHIIRWENRQLVWCERCFRHELKYVLLNPSYLMERLKQKLLNRGIRFMIERMEETIGR